MHRPGAFVRSGTGRPHGRCGGDRSGGDRTAAGAFQERACPTQRGNARTLRAGAGGRCAALFVSKHEKKKWRERERKARGPLGPREQRTRPESAQGGGG